MADRLPIAHGETISFPILSDEMTDAQLEAAFAMEGAGYGEMGQYLTSIELSFAFNQVRLAADRDADEAIRLWRWVGALDLVDDVPDLSEPPASMQTIVEVFVPTPEGGSFESRVDDAFVRALEGLQQLQRAYARATGRPIRLVTRTTLPQLIPIPDGTAGPGRPSKRDSFVPRHRRPNRSDTARCPSVQG